MLTTTGVLEDGDGNLHDDVIVEVKRYIMESSYDKKISEAVRLLVRSSELRLSSPWWYRLWSGQAYYVDDWSNVDP
jgi:hypothetical protein